MQSIPGLITTGNRLLQMLTIEVFFSFFKKMAIPGLFFFILVFKTMFNNCFGDDCIQTGVGSDQPSNWATTTAPHL